MLGKDGPDNVHEKQTLNAFGNPDCTGASTFLWTFNYGYAWCRNQNDGNMKKITQYGAITSAAIPPRMSATFFADDDCVGADQATFTNDTDEVKCYNIKELLGEGAFAVELSMN